MHLCLLQLPPLLHHHLPLPRKPLLLPQCPLLPLQFPQLPVLYHSRHQILYLTVQRLVLSTGATLVTHPSFSFLADVCKGALLKATMRAS